jgi:hypothetical protein
MSPGRYPSLLARPSTYPLGWATPTNEEIERMLSNVPGDRPYAIPMFEAPEGLEYVCLSPMWFQWFHLHPDDVARDSLAKQLVYWLTAAGRGIFPDQYFVDSIRMSSSIEFYLEVTGKPFHLTKVPEILRRQVLQWRKATVAPVRQEPLSMEPDWSIMLPAPTPAIAGPTPDLPAIYGPASSEPFSCALTSYGPISHGSAIGHGLIDYGPASCAFDGYEPINDEAFGYEPICQGSAGYLPVTHGPVSHAFNSFQPMSFGPTSYGPTTARPEMAEPTSVEPLDTGEYYQMSFRLDLGNLSMLDRGDVYPN